MKINLFALAGILTIIALSCSKTSEDKLQSSTPGGNTCDTLNMKYAENVAPIIDAYCLDCHGTSTNSISGGINLVGYDNLNVRVGIGDLLPVLTHADGFPQMPQNRAKLSDCDINIIRSWINNGAQNN